MKRIIALAFALFASAAFANAPVPGVIPDACPVGGAPALGAGVSPDGPVCVGQSVRDAAGHVWQLRSTGVVNGVPAYGVFQTAPVPADQIAMINCGKVRMQGGVMQYLSTIPQSPWMYWSFTMHRAWPVGVAEPPPPTSPAGPPGTG
jgi:hypothetical protein